MNKSQVEEIFRTRVTQGLGGLMPGDTNEKRLRRARYLALPLLLDELIRELERQPSLSRLGWLTLPRAEGLPQRFQEDTQWYWMASQSSWLVLPRSQLHLCWTYVLDRELLPLLNRPLLRAWASTYELGSIQWAEEGVRRAQRKPIIGQNTWTRCLLFLRLLLAGLLLDPLAGWHRTKLWQRTRGFLQTGFSKLSYPPRCSYATHVVKLTPEGEQKLLAKKVGFFKNHYVGITRNEQGQALSDSHATT